MLLGLPPIPETDHYECAKSQDVVKGVRAGKCIA